MTLLVVIACGSGRKLNNEIEKVRVIAFFTATQDPAHISFVREANEWFSGRAQADNFTYDSTSRWSDLNEAFLSQYDVVMFLDTRPEDSLQRAEFQKYVEHGGGWIGFHFSAFSLKDSAYPQNWDWYHEQFLGCGPYNGNTWRPTSATLRVENTQHPVTNGIDTLIISAPNEWYSWKNDLRAKPDIEILLAIDDSSFPLGTGPKQHEIWHEGYFPVVWANKKYRMVYFNMGHNDMDYENGTNQQLSSSFGSTAQNQLIINALKWVGKR
jgi:hypothetical protein